MTTYFIVPRALGINESDDLSGAHIALPDVMEGNVDALIDGFGAVPFRMAAETLPTALAGSGIDGVLIPEDLLLDIDPIHFARLNVVTFRVDDRFFSGDGSFVLIPSELPVLPVDETDEPTDNDETPGDVPVGDDTGDYLLSSTPSLSERSDLAGLKIAVHGGFDDNVVSLLSAAGAAPLRLPFSEVYTALQTGVIDAVLLPGATISGLDPSYFEGLDLDSFLLGEGFFAGIQAGSNSLLLTPIDIPANADDGTGGTDDASSEYSGNQSSYTLTLSPTANTITDRRSNDNGTTELNDISFLEFDSGTFDLSQFGGTTGLSEQDFESFIELYIAYFNRAPDAIGLNFWGTAFANGTTLEEMATLFVDQDETRATYPARTTNQEFAESVYDNVFGRTPDQAGFEFWVDALDSNAVSRDQFILEVLRGVQPGSPDRSYLDAKVDIGTYFAVIRGMSDVEDAVLAMQLFDGTEVSIMEAAAAIDDIYTEALDPNTGEFLMPLVGVLDDPFAIA